MTPPKTNWGGDLTHRVAPERQAAYLRCCVRLSAYHDGDELLILTDFVDIHTRIGLDTADRMAHSADRSEMAAQRIESATHRHIEALKAIELERQRIEVLTAQNALIQKKMDAKSKRDLIRNRYVRKFKRRCGVSIVALSVVLSSISSLWFQHQADQKVAVAQALALQTLNDTLSKPTLDFVDWALENDIPIERGKCNYTDGTQGVTISSTKAIYAEIKKDENGEQRGYLYFRASH